MPDRLRFGCFELRPAERRLLRNGEPVRLGVRAFDLLLALVQHPDRLLTKGELLDLAWPGLVVEEANVQVQVSALRKVLGPQAIATIPGLGYRFSALLETRAEIAHAPEANGSVGDLADPPLPDIPSIAVLPFANMSVDPEQGYFADGVTEDIITALSRFHSLFVIAHSSSVTYRGRGIDVRTIASQLGVRYVSTEVCVGLGTGFASRHGSLIVRREGIFGRSTLTASWMMFSRCRSTSRKASSLPSPLELRVPKCRRRAGAAASLSAYEIAVRAWSDCLAIYRHGDTARIGAIIAEARRALSIDPESTLALNTLRLHSGYTCSSEAPRAWRGVAQGTRCGAASVRTGRFRQSLLRAQGTPPTHAPHEEGGAIAYDEALNDLHMAHHLNPNDHLALRVLGHTEAVSGEPLKGIAHLQQALRLNPRDPFSVNVYAMLSLAHFFARSYAEGVRWGLLAATSSDRAHWATVSSHELCRDRGHCEGSGLVGSRATSGA